MPGVFYNEESILEVGEDWVSRLKSEAQLSPRRRARLCLHRGSQDSVQEMLIVFCRDALVRPHRSLDKSESFHVVAGELRVLIFDDNGRVAQTFDMGPPGSGKTFMCRFASGPWYTYIPLSEFIAVHETARGPFLSSDTVFPNWAPEEGPELKAFLTEVAGI